MPVTSSSPRTCPTTSIVVAVPVSSDQGDAAGLDAARAAGRGARGPGLRRQRSARSLVAARAPTASATGRRSGSGPSADGRPRPAPPGRRPRSPGRHARTRPSPCRLLDAVADAGRAQPAAAAQALAEGAGARRLPLHRPTSPSPSRRALERVVVVGGGGPAGRAPRRAWARASPRAWYLARDLVNTPGRRRSPRRRWPRPRSRSPSARASQITVLDPTRSSSAGLGGLLGVNRGSEQPPRFIELAYAPAGARGIAGPGRQGHHVRLRRPVAQDRRRHDDHEERHGRRRRHPRGHVGHRAPSRPRCKVTAYIPMHRQHDRRRRHPGRRRAARSATARPSRCSTPTPRAA